MKETAVTFPCEGDTLLGILHHSKNGGPSCGILIVVGGPQYRVGSHRQFVLMARQFAASGYPVFRFDYRGMGDSSGEPINFENVENDVRAAMDAFFDELPSLRGIVIFGLCDAASAAVIYCRSDHRVTGLVLANPWVRTDAGEAKAYVRHYYGTRVFQRSFWAKILAGDLEIRASIRNFLLAVRRATPFGGGSRQREKSAFLTRMEEGMAAFRGPMLLLLSERDMTAREFEDLCSQSSNWAEMTTGPLVQRFKVRDADHTFSSASSLIAASSRVLRWLSHNSTTLSGRVGLAGLDTGK